MSRSSQTSFCIAPLPKPLLAVLFILTSLSCLSFALQDPVSEKVISELTSIKPTSYNDIDALLKPHKRDTLALNSILAGIDENAQPEVLSYILNQKGTVYRNRSNFNKALLLHHKALDVSETNENVEFSVYSLNMIGVVHRRTDAIKTALEHYQRALEIAESVENPTRHLKRNINIALNGIGNLYQTLGQYDLAIPQFERALKLETDLNNKLGQAINNQNIGECLEQQGNLEEALNRYRKSLALNEDINNAFGQIICKNSIGQIYLKKDMPNAAFSLLKGIVQPISDIGDKYVWTSVLINMGWAHMELHQYKAARKFMEEGLRMSLENNMTSQIVNAKRKFSELEAKIGNFQQALRLSQEAESLDNELKSDKNQRYINELILRYQAERRDNQISTLANENELVKLKLRRNQTTILVSTLVICLVGTILFIMYRQHQSNYEKRVMGLEQNMLRSQMNPHFLFNSLNSIKLYIINNDKKNAVHYLNKFSKLVRRILEGSTLKETTLAEELETAELYLNIENIRFSEDIKHTITIEEGIDPEQMKIPSLVLQPFLENAIWHGLSSKEEKKLWVNISKKDDIHMHIAIVDNGVGRAASEKMKEKRVIKRKSVGIDITKERLANFAKDYQYGFDVEIIDLYDDEGQPKGTKVILEIPMI